MSFASTISLDYNELIDSISKAKAELLNLKMAHAVSPIENPGFITKKRKDIARLKTALSIKSKSSK